MRDIAAEAKRDPSFLASDKYIEVIMRHDGLTQLSYQMGPNCNLRCSHCYGNYGPHRKGLPKPKIVEKSLEDAVKIEIVHIGLTDGEPIRYQNKKVMKLFASYSNQISLDIFTNGKFAGTEENTLMWFKFLRDNGFDLDRAGNGIIVSAGAVYKVPIGNYARISWGLREVFPTSDIGNHLDYKVKNTNIEEDKRIISYIAVLIERFLGKEKDAEIFRDDENELTGIRVFPMIGSPIEIDYSECFPRGNAKNLRIVKKNFPLENFTIENIGFKPGLDTIGMEIYHDGRVAFGFTEECVRPGRVYENVKDESLGKIKKRILSDDVFQGFQLGGPRFLYFLAQKINPKFRIRGRSSCDICTSFFDDLELVRAVRTRLNKRGLIKEYKRYMEKLVEMGVSLGLKEAIEVA